MGCPQNQVLTDLLTWQIHDLFRVYVMMRKLKVYATVFSHGCDEVQTESLRYTDLCDEAQTESLRYTDFSMAQEVPKLFYKLI